jgi:ribosomal-protein-serine acetyltransferase
MCRIQIEPNLHIELLHTIHAKELYALIDVNRDHLREWMPWVDSTKSVGNVNDFIKTTMKQYADDLGFQVGIFYQNEIAGVSGFKPLSNINRSGELGYWLNKEFEGQGIMTKVNEKIIEIGFRNLDLNKITIQCAEENNKSRAVAERLGFKSDGILRQNEWLYDHFVNHVVYSLLKSEYKIS